MTATQLTMSVLLSISQHLSTRTQCKDVNYEVTIRSGRISFYPDVKVFPNVHRRKQSDKETIIEHVLRYHYDNELVLPTGIVTDTGGEYLINTDKLVPGHYVYRSSIDGKRRKWFRE